MGLDGPRCVWKLWWREKCINRNKQWLFSKERTDCFSVGSHPMICALTNKSYCFALPIFSDPDSQKGLYLCTLSLSVSTTHFSFFWPWKRIILHLPVSQFPFAWTRLCLPPLSIVLFGPVTHICNWLTPDPYHFTINQGTVLPSTVNRKHQATPTCWYLPATLYGIKTQNSPLCRKISAYAGNCKLTFFSHALTVAIFSVCLFLGSWFSLQCFVLIHSPAFSPFRVTDQVSYLYNTTCNILTFSFFRQNTREQPSPSCPHHEDQWGVEVQLHSFLISALDGSEWSASCPGQSSPGKEPLGTHWTGRWVGWAGPESVWAIWRRQKCLPSARNSDTCCDLQPAVWIKEW